MGIHLFKAHSIEKVSVDGVERIKVVGIIDPKSLSYLKCDNDEQDPHSYQRVVLDKSKRREDIRRGFQQGSLPEVTLSMRGLSIVTYNDSVMLEDDVFIVDGQQRISVALEMLQEDPLVAIEVRAVVYLNSDRGFERKLFEDLNTKQTRVGQGLLIKNARVDSPLIDTIVRMTNAPEFTLRGRVSWATGSSRREDLLLGVNVLGATLLLHRHLGVQVMAGDHEQVMQIVKGAAEHIEPERMVANTLIFFEAYIKAFQIQDVKYRDRVSFLRPTFLKALATFFDRHENFWNGRRLVIGQSTIERLGRFSWKDHSVDELSKTSGKSAVRDLVRLMVQHFEETKRRNDVALVWRKRHEETVPEEQPA